MAEGGLGIEGRAGKWEREAEYGRRRGKCGREKQELGWGPTTQPRLTSLGRLGLDCLRARRPLLGGTGVLPSSRSTRPSSRAWKASRVSDFL